MALPCGTSATPAVALSPGCSPASRSRTGRSAWSGGQPGPPLDLAQHAAPGHPWRSDRSWRLPSAYVVSVSWRGRLRKSPVERLEGKISSKSPQNCWTRVPLRLPKSLGGRLRKSPAERPEGKISSKSPQNCWIRVRLRLPKSCLTWSSRVPSGASIL